MPVVGAVNHLEPDALVEILTEPRNALVKQYRKIFEFENVELEFTPEALDAIAEEAIKRNTGARGLRSILEETLLETMYDIPGRDDVTKVVVTRVRGRRRRRSRGCHARRRPPRQLAPRGV